MENRFFFYQWVKMLLIFGLLYTFFFQGPYPIRDSVGLWLHSHARQVEITADIITTTNREAGNLE